MRRKEERRLGGCYEEARLPAWGRCCLGVADDL